MKMINFCLAVLLILVSVSCDDEKNETASESTNVPEFTQESTHVICNFYKSYNIGMKKTINEDSIVINLYNAGRSKEEIEELIMQHITNVCDYDICDNESEIEK